MVLACNGKSTVLNALMEMMGPDYAMKAGGDLLLAKRNNDHPTALTDLHGKRLVACIETDDGRRLAESLVKELTGGDPIRGVVCGKISGNSCRRTKSFLPAIIGRRFAAQIMLFGEG